MKSIVLDPTRIEFCTNARSRPNITGSRCSSLRHQCSAQRSQPPRASGEGRDAGGSAHTLGIIAHFDHQFKSEASRHEESSEDPAKLVATTGLKQSEVAQPSNCKRNSSQLRITASSDSGKQQFGQLVVSSSRRRQRTSERSKSESRPTLDIIASPLIVLPISIVRPTQF